MSFPEAPLSERYPATWAAALVGFLTLFACAMTWAVRDDSARSEFMYEQCKDVAGHDYEGCRSKAWHRWRREER